MGRNSIINDKIPSDDILEGLYKLRTRESEKRKIVLELYDLEIHQKKSGPDCHRLKTMVKRSIEQDFRNEKFGARNENHERKGVRAWCREPEPDAEAQVENGSLVLHRITSKELAPIHSVPECLFYRTKSVADLGKNALCAPPR